MTRSQADDCLDDDLLADFAAGQLGPTARERAERHIDMCSACAEVLGDLVRLWHGRASHSAAGSSAPTEHAFELLAAMMRVGTHVGRYWVDRHLGTGGMGSVFSGFDPELRREVAIKFLRTHFGGYGSSMRQRARFLREAQSMARLSHPNVVPVFDVGAASGRVFVVMARVRGVTLDRWIRTQDPHWREVVLALEQAGEGLAAAHAAGLVHRDFKPSNVMIENGGQARVMDFGLASSVNTWSALHSGGAPRPCRPGLTQAGTVVGTPGYMAPEQASGGGADLRSDIYSFCVTLREALTDTRGTRSRGVPPGIWTAIERGLAPSVGDRWPSMQPLLAALRAARRPRMHRRWLTAAAAASLVGVIGVDRASSGASGEIHTGVPSETALAERDEVPDETVAQLRELLAIGSIHDQATDHAAAERAYTTALWRAESIGDDETAVLAASSLVYTVGCGQSRFEQGKAWARHARALIHRAGDQPAHRSLLAQNLGTLLLRSGSEAEALDQFEQAVVLLEELHGARANETVIALEKLGVAWRHIGRHEDARRVLVRVLDIQTEHLGGRHPAIVRALGNLAGVDIVERRFDDARDRLNRALEIHLESSDSENSVTADLLHNLGLIEQEQRRWAQACKYYERALEQRATARDPDHAALSDTLNNLGNTLLEMGAPGEARPHLERAMTIRAELYGAKHPAMGASILNIGLVHAELGDAAKAMEHYERALEVWEEALPETHPLLLHAFDAIAEVAIELHRPQRALEVLYRALELRAHVETDPQPQGLATTHMGLARALAMIEGPSSRARAHARRALADYERLEEDALARAARDWLRDHPG